MRPVTSSISVVIPTHNGRASITQAVTSVLSQSHRDLELVVVCDGDGARTRELLAGVSDSRLRIVEQPSSGVSAARNLGAAVAMNDWVTFLDDDDCARPQWLETWAANISDDTMVVTARLAFWEGERLLTTRQCRVSLTDPTMDASSILPGGFAIRRDAFTAVGGFDESLTYAENQDLGLRLLDDPSTTEGAAVVTLPDVLVDFHREAAPSRVKRYRTAPADSARIFLSRYERRLAHDPRTAASLLRIISRSERHEHQPRAAIWSSVRACRTQPLHWANYRSLALAVITAPAGALPGLARGRQGSP